MSARLRPEAHFHQTLPSWCHQSALDPVKVAEPVQIRPREPFQQRAKSRDHRNHERLMQPSSILCSSPFALSFIMHKAKSRAAELQPPITECEPRVHVHFSSTDTSESANRSAWGNTMPRQLKTRSLTVKTKPAPRCPAISSSIIHPSSLNSAL